MNAVLSLLRKRAASFILGVIGGFASILFWYALILFLRKYFYFDVNNFDPLQNLYLFVPFLVAGLLLWLLNRKPLALGVVLSFPFFYMFVLAMLGIACSQGNCL